MKNLEKNIFLVKDFLSEKELLGVLDNTWIDWEKSIKKRVSELFNHKYIVEGTGNIKKIKAGESTEAHSDQHDSKCDCGWCIDNPDKHFIYGIVIYLNSNYTGGEIRYTKKNIIHKPVARSLLCHPASEEYEHEVLRVNSGERKYLSFFLSLKKNML